MEQWPACLRLQVVEDHQYSKALHVYSFGIIMWEMLTWDMPWEELNAFQVQPQLCCTDSLNRHVFHPNRPTAQCVSCFNTSEG